MVFPFLFSVLTGLTNGILLLAISGVLYLAPIHPFPRIFGVHLSLPEIIQDKMAFDAVNNQYTSAVKEAIAAKNTIACEALPVVVNGLFMGDYIRQTSGGSEYPHYGNWLSREYCKDAVASVNASGVVNDYYKTIHLEP